MRFQPSATRFLAFLITTYLVAGVSKAQSQPTALLTPADTDRLVAEPTIPDPAQPALSLLDGLRSGQLGLEALGRGDNTMTLSVTNRTRHRIRVVLPPGLIASGATGQFGGMGGMGGGGMGGMGGGGMGGGGMGGGGMGGGGMGGGGGMRGGGVIPAPMGMMMLGTIIMYLVGDLDSWDPSSLMMGMGGMGGGGMGGMGGGGMGGMGGGGMGGGGFRSIPPTDLPNALLQPNQTRHLVTRMVSLNPPTLDGKANFPVRGEILQIDDCAALGGDARTELALRRLAVDKAPEAVSQLVLWNVRHHVEWGTLAWAARSWANDYELALARQFVRRIDASEGELAPIAAATLYVDVRGGGEPGKSLKKSLEGSYTLGLSVELGAPPRPDGPSLACLVEIESPESKEAVVLLYTSDESGTRWKAMGKFWLPLEDPIRLADTLAEGISSRLVRAQLIEGKKVKGKPTYKIRIDNASPLLLNAVVLDGIHAEGDAAPSMLAGFSLPPHRSMSFSATPQVVERLGLGSGGIRIVADDFSGL